MHGGHDGARPGSRECGAIGKNLSYLTWCQWSLKNHSPQLVVCPPPAPTSPAWLAQTLLLLPLFMDRTRICLEHPCLSDLFDDLFRSFLHFLRASTCYIAVAIQNITKARNIEISFDNLIL